MNKSIMKHWITAILCAAFIFYLSGRQSLGVPLFPYADKILHIIAYAVLAFFISRALCKAHSVGYFNIILMGMFITGIYGLTDEVHQLFVPTRSADPFDLLADFFGGLIGSIIYVQLSQGNKKRS